MHKLGLRVVVEIGLADDRNWLVTAFMARERYLKKREENCLFHKKTGNPAGTAVPPILAPPKADGGSRFSTLQETQTFYTRLKEKSQDFKLKDSLFEQEGVQLEHPAEPDHGDYSTNAALVLASKLDQNPRKIAQKIVENLEKPDFVERIEVAGPGFINFWLSQEWLISQVVEIASPQPKRELGRYHGGF